MKKNIIKTISLNKKNKRKIFYRVLILGLIVSTLISTLSFIKREINLGWLRKCYFAHRGLFNEIAPENSIGAFQKAIDSDFAIELDVQFTKDKKVVVFHDYTLERLTNVSKNLCDLSYEEIKKLNLLNTSEKIPLLEEVLTLVDGKVPLLIEIKNCSDVITLGESVANILQNYKGKYAIQSFDPCVLKWLKKNRNYILTGQLIGRYEGIEEFKHCKNMVLDFKKFFLEYKLDFLSIDSYDIENLAIRTFRVLRIPILSWTIRNENELEKIKKFADGYIFDSFIPNKYDK